MADSYLPTGGQPDSSSPLVAGNEYQSNPTPPTTDNAAMRRSDSTSSTKVDQNNTTPSRSGTLKKRDSVKRRTSLRRSNSRKSMRAGSIKGVGDTGGDSDYHNVFHTPVPTSGNPTDVLANRFQAWRKLLKDLVTYFREIQNSYENRSKSLLKVANVINNTSNQSLFLAQGGLDDATNILRQHNKQAQTEANKAKDIENDVINQLNGLRSDLNQKIKEIKSLSGDFKNSVEKEKESTRKAVATLEDSLANADYDPAASSGKNDPFIVKMGVDRQVEKQIEEENYLHRAYLNLEGSGRELEAIVVGEIQKAYNAYAGILKRESDHSSDAVEELRAGPIAMPKDHEWNAFVEKDPHFISPNIPVRRVEDIQYPGKHHPSTIEIKGGMLERKSKYLKSYTPGWYVLSPTHLHEFKSADHIHTQTPVMSLYLGDQKLGSHSQIGGGSHKFSLKGRQTGSMHRGHSWVFRAETYETMMAWYEDIKTLTEKSGEEKSAFVRSHARSVSGGSNNRAASISSDGMDEDEADEVPYAAHQSVASEETPVLETPKRPEPGGRFPSDINVNRDRSQAPLSPSSNASSDDNNNNGKLAEADTNAIVAAGGLPDGSPAANKSTSRQPENYKDINKSEVAASHPPAARDFSNPQELPANNGLPPSGNDSNWVAPAAAGAAGGAGITALGAAAYRHHNKDEDETDDVETPQPSFRATQASATTGQEQPLAATGGYFDGTHGPTEETSRTGDVSRKPDIITAGVIDNETSHTVPQPPQAATLVDHKSPASESGDSMVTTPAASNVGISAQAVPLADTAAALGRTTTEVSVSQLHVPGEFPPTPALS